MQKVGAREAQTHLNRLLDRVAQGEHIVITRGGAPVAVLVPYCPRRRRPFKEVRQKLEQFRQLHRLEGLSLRELIQEGRM